MIIKTIKQKIQKCLRENNFKYVHRSKIEVEYPNVKKFGDYSTNIALKIAKKFRKRPLTIAKIIAKQLSNDNMFIKVETKKPGFVNFYISKHYLLKVLNKINTEKEKFGTDASVGTGKKILLEFVSANPTGPLNVVNARAAAFGDSLANFFSKLGYVVEREFYINDAGHQIDLLVESVEVELYRLESMPVKEVDGGYHGEYVVDVARKILEFEHHSIFHYSDKRKFKKIRQYTIREILKKQRESLARFNVFFDNWISEIELREKGSVEDILTYLSETGQTYEKDDAVWVETSKFGDSKDRVIMKSDGTTTYLVPDLAYHISKYKRGYSLMIDILGPDHHGHFSKLKSGLKILGYDVKKLSVIFLQQVNFIRDNEKVKMSKRAGNFFSLQKLLDDVGTDATRFFFLMRKTNTPLDFDVELAKKQSSENPVFYVQYAHARINSIMKMAKFKKIILAEFKSEYLQRLRHPEELDLIRCMMKYPDLIVHIGESYDVNLMTTYLVKLAAAFHSFYQKRKIVNLKFEELSLARLYLCKAVQNVLANGLNLLGIRAPERM